MGEDKRERTRNQKKSSEPAQSCSQSEPHGGVHCYGYSSECERQLTAISHRHPQPQFRLEATVHNFLTLGYHTFEHESGTYKVSVSSPPTFRSYCFCSVCILIGALHSFWNLCPQHLSKKSCDRGNKRGTLKKTVKNSKGKFWTGDDVLKRASWRAQLVTSKDGVRFSSLCEQIVQQFMWYHQRFRESKEISARKRTKSETNTEYLWSLNSGAIELKTNIIQ